MKAFTRSVPPLVIIGGVLLAIASIQTVHAAGYGLAASEPRSAGAQRSRVVLPRGIYLYREQLANDAQFDQALGVPGIDGMAVVLDWSTIQPLRDSFRTETIDSQLKLARQHNLPVELVARAGRSVPVRESPATVIQATLLKLKNPACPREGRRLRHTGNRGRCSRHRRLPANLR
jgi:hypothetical protein